VPVVVSSRCPLSGEGHAALQTLEELLLLPEVRCPFSSSAGDPSTQFADNGWIFAVRGPDALSFALALDLQPAPVESASKSEARTPAVFWGILDLKYDGSQPVLDRVRVLETGDGRSSKFSGDGAPIAEKARSSYLLRESSVLQKFHVISADKKLTHDLIDLAGYGHIVPDQVCHPRCYDPGLADRISAELGLE
ncbi:unnamed protein product, partial [Polarella glacialis]